MNRKLFSTFAAFCLMQLALGVTVPTNDLKADPSVLKSAATPPTPISVVDSGHAAAAAHADAAAEHYSPPVSSPLPPLQCTNADNLLESLDDLSKQIDDVENFDIIDEEPLNKLVKSLLSKPKKLVAPIQKLVQAANLYQDTLNSAADEAIEELRKMTDVITSDEDTADLFDSKKKDVTPAQVTEGCNLVEKAGEYVSGFSSKIDGDKVRLTKALSPHLFEILSGIESFIPKFNGDNVNIAEAKEEINAFTAKIYSAIDFIKSNLDESLDDFAARIRADGIQCEKFFDEFYKQFAKLLGVPKKN